MQTHWQLSRRQFVARTAVLVTAIAGPAVAGPADAPEPVIDIHQHGNYGGKRDATGTPTGTGRTNEELLAHQRAMGVTQTVLLPAGRPVRRPSTHDGVSNGLLDTCAGVEECRALALAHPGVYFYGANEVPDLPEAAGVIEKHLKLGAVCIGEQKFGVECDAPEMQRLYQIAAAYEVPILMHWQFGRFNAGFDRFTKMLTQHPRTKFVGHAQTMWAHIDGGYTDDARKLYPTGPVSPGGWTDRYLRDYPNFYADLSAGSGLNALTRDPDFTREFLQRHQDKLIYGSDCADKSGTGKECSGWLALGRLRELAGSKAVERKLLYENAKRVYRL